MNAAFGLLVGSAIVGLYGHRSVSTVSLVALTAADHPTAGIFRLAGGCWTRPASGTVPGWREALAALGLVAAATILVRIAWVVVLRVRRRRRTSGHAAGLRLLAADVPSGEPLWVRDDRPLALSIAGRPGVIVMSDALHRLLTPAAIAATLEHERAHLRGRHHLLVAVVDVLAALPHPAETPDSGQIGGQPRRA